MITVESFNKSCGCRSVGECHHNSTAEMQALDALVDAFAAEMKKKLRRKALEGYSGWDDPAYAEGMRAAMLEHALRGPGQEVDVANLAAMLWNIGSNALGKTTDASARPLYNQAELDAAIIAEREACAKVAEAGDRKLQKTAKAIADAIRRRSTT